MFKKLIISLLLSAVMLLTLASCGGTVPSGEPKNNTSSEEQTKEDPDQSKKEQTLSELEGVWWPAISGPVESILVIKEGKYCYIRWPLLYADDAVISDAINKKETLDYTSFITGHNWFDLGFNEEGDTILSDTKEVLQLNENGALQCIQRQPAYDEWRSWSYNKKADDVMTDELLIDDFNEVASEYGWPAYSADAGTSDPSAAKDTSEFLIEEAGLKVVYDADWTAQEPIDYQDPDFEEPIGVVNKLNLKRLTGTPVQILIDLHEDTELNDRYINDVAIPSIQDTLDLFYGGNGWVSEAKTVNVNGLNCILIDEHIEADIDCQDTCFYYLSLSLAQSGPYTMAEINIRGNGIEKLHQYAEEMLFSINDGSSADTQEGKTVTDPETYAKISLIMNATVAFDYGRKVSYSECISHVIENRSYEIIHLNGSFYNVNLTGTCRPLKEYPNYTIPCEITFRVDTEKDVFFILNDPDNIKALFMLYALGEY